MELTLRQGSNGLTNLFIVMGLAMILGLSGSIAFRIPFSPIPFGITGILGLFFSVLFGMRGAYAVIAYIGQGLVGLPVFARGGSGILHLLGPSGGYLVGLLFASFVVALFTERLKEKSPNKIFGLLSFGNLLLFIFGLPQLALYVGWKAAILGGFFLFIPTDLLKLLAAHKGLAALKVFSQTSKY